MTADTINMMGAGQEAGSSADSAFIDIVDVSKVYQQKHGFLNVLENVNLNCAYGEFVAIVGASGCGKSTLLNIVGGLIEATSGHVTVRGVDIRGPDTERGMIFQQYALFPWLTAQQNVEFGLRVKGMPRKKRADMAQYYLKLVGLEKFGGVLPKELSGGMKQRCAIARAYAVNPAVLLMDEPFGAIDEFTRASLQEQLLDIWTQQNRTILFITHDVEEAIFLSNRVVIMGVQPGRIRNVVPIELPYPRNEDIRLSDEFTHLRATIWREVHAG